MKRKSCLVVPVVVLALVLTMSLAAAADSHPITMEVMQDDPVINEVRIDQVDADDDEYFELAGAPGASLDGLTYLVIGDGEGLSGVIENVTDLSGQAIPASGYFVAAESTFSLGSANLVTSLNFENSDNVTHLLVEGFTGSSGDDLDTNDDGTLDVTPWTRVVDLIALIEEQNPPSGTEYHYGPPTVGPDGTFVPSHAFRCVPDWQIGEFDPAAGGDTPGATNMCAVINEIQISTDSTDWEFFELQGAPGLDLSGLTLIGIESDVGASAGTIDRVIDLAGQTIPADGFWLGISPAGAARYGVAGEMSIPDNTFENSTATYFLVASFTGAQGNDLDTDDDGVLDSTPWDAILDGINIRDSAGDFDYGAVSVGPDGDFLPAGTFRCPNGPDGVFDGNFLNFFTPDGTPGTANTCPVGMSKTGSPCAVAGTDLYYSVELYNQGGVDITGVVLTDTLPAGTTYVDDDSTWPCKSCAVGASGELTWTVGTLPANGTLSLNLTVTVDALVATGTVLDNVAEFTGTLSGDDLSDNTDTWSLTVVQPDRIHQVQGAAQLSPYDGQLACQVPGIVTAVSYNSFYMQDPNPDADDATSEGILVYTGGVPGVDVGDSVLVSGDVSEYYPGGAATGNLPTTELSDREIRILSSGNALPAATVVGLGGRLPPTQVIDDDGNTTFDPATDGLDFYESMEGMRLQLNDAVAVGPTNYYGEIPVVPDAQAYGGLYTPRGGVVIQSDDYNPERVIIDDALYSSEPAVKPGAAFDTPIIGVLDYNFGNFHLLNPDPLPAVTPSGILSETTSLEGTSGGLTIATFNVLNLDPGDTTFDALGNQIANHLLSPDIIVLEEIQDNNGETNDGTVDASLTYQALIAAIQGAGGPVYEYRDVAPLDNQDGGAPGGNIRVGFLFRPDRVTFVDRGTAGPTDATVPGMGATGVELSLSPGRVDPTNAAFLDSRKPLAGEFVFNGHKLFVVGNHLNSKGGDDPLFGWTQPPVLSSEVQREAQAAVINGFVDQILTLDPEAYVVVLGDLNDFQFSEPISDVLAADVLTNLIYTLPAEERYSYIYDGNSQALDHILVSQALWERTGGYDIVHVNAEWPAVDRPSDHDPCVAYLQVLAPDLSNSVKLVEPAGPVVSGDLLTYTVVLSNSGDLDAVVSVDDTLPPELLLVEGFDGGGLSWSGVVTAGEEVTLTLVARADPTLVSSTTVRNVVTIDDGMNPTFDVASPDTTILVPDLSLSKDADPTSGVKPGDVLTFTLTLHNTGNGTAMDVVLVDALPVGLSFGGWAQQSGATEVNGTITWMGDVAAGSEVTVVYTATVAMDDSLYGQIIDNVAICTSYNAGSDVDGVSISMFTLLKQYLPLIARNGGGQ